MTSRSFCTMSMSSARLISGAWCNFIPKTRPSPHWRCKTGRLPDTCSSTSSSSFAAGDPGAMQNLNWCDSARQAQALAFSGIHVISPRLLAMMTEEGAFSIITSYLHLAARGEKILAFRADEYYWRDLGSPDSVRQAAQEICLENSWKVPDSFRRCSRSAARFAAGCPRFAHFWLAWVVF